ncbi:MAG: YitT family protein [Bacteroidales bacterium]|nr:YitT family protein [Candidatus Cryptobacteroides caccocaballi]
MVLDRKKILKVFGEYLILTLGTFLYCVPWDWFVIPNDYSSGGVTGLLTLVQYATNGVIPVGTSYLVVNAVLLLLAFAILGKGFGVRTIYCIAVSTLFFDILPHFESMYCVEGGLLYVPDNILIPVIAGIIEGLGLGIVLRFGGSTGGSDIFAMIVNKYWPISPGKFYLVTDAVIIAMVLLLPGRTFADMIYGYLMMIVSSFFVDYVLVGNKSSVQVLIFSEKSEEISNFLMHELDKGVTALKSVGCYKKQEMDVLITIVRRKGLRDVTAAVKEIDKDAFISVSPANSVYGEGFEEVKAGIKTKKLVKKSAESAK